MKKSYLVAVICSVFIGLFMIGIATSKSEPAGQPFQALWDAIDYLQEQIDNIGDSHWSSCTNDSNSVCTPHAVGIGTDYSDKMLKVAGDALFINPNNNTYFFIEQGRDADVRKPVRVD